jgi:hypothetical protein
MPDEPCQLITLATALGLLLKNPKDVLSWGNIILVRPEWLVWEMKCDPKVAKIIYSTHSRTKPQEEIKESNKC